MGLTATRGALWWNLRDLFSFGRPFHREGRRGPTGDDLADLVEIFGAYERLVLDRPIAHFPRREFFVLKFRVRGHPAGPVVAGELEHREVQGVEAGQGDELETVAHARQFTLERRDRLAVELLPPVEGGGAVVREE